MRKLLTLATAFVISGYAKECDNLAPCQPQHHCNEFGICIAGGDSMPQPESESTLLGVRQADYKCNDEDDCVPVTEEDLNYFESFQDKDESGYLFDEDYPW